MAVQRKRFRARQRLGQYRIEECLAIGGFAEVYRAYDTVEGIRVALKIPHEHLSDPETMESFRREVRLVARLDHPNILPIKTAGLVDGVFLVVNQLAKENLAERMQRRMSTTLVLDLSELLLEALAYAHREKVVHCDVKPDNILLFPGSKLRLADFGLARVIQRTMLASGSGTVGYISPEQALGKPTRRSDVFSAALVIYRMLSGGLPEWPFRWPYPGADRLRRRGCPAIEKVLRRALSVDEHDRYDDAGKFLRAFRRARLNDAGGGNA